MLQEQCSNVNSAKGLLDCLNVLDLLFNFFYLFFCNRIILESLAVIEWGKTPPYCFSQNNHKIKSR